MKSKGCFSCPIKCSRISEVQGGDPSKIEGPEYETIDALGPVVGNDDLEVIIPGDRICNDLGILSLWVLSSL